MSTAEAQTLLEQLCILYGIMLGLVFLLTLLHLFRAKHVDPLPLLPLTGLMLTTTTGLKLAVIWFGMLYYPSPSVIDLAAYQDAIMDPAVIRPLSTIMCGLFAHYLLYSFAELRHASRQQRLGPSTRILFHGQLICIFICILVHVKLFELLILENLRRAGQPERSIYVHEPEGPTRVWRMQFFPW